MTLKIYSIQVSGIRCTNCAGKIKKALQTSLPQIKKIHVNVMQQKVLVTLENDDALLQKIKQCLISINFNPIGSPILLSDTQSVNRTINFNYSQLEKQNEQLILNKIRNLPGVLDIDIRHFYQEKQSQKSGISNQKIKVSVTYNSEIIKGRQIVDEMQLIDINFFIVNDRVNSFKNQQKIATHPRQMAQSIILVSYFMIFNMILPQTGEWYEQFVCFPIQFGIYSCVMIFNIFITLYTIYKFGRKFFKNTYYNFKQYRLMNMETLVTLGSSASLFLFVFFLGKYTIEYYSNPSFDKMKAMMVLTDCLTSSTLIIVIVTLGKYIQTKIKKKIERMTAQIFPESELFKDMAINYIQLKNRNLMILKEKVYDVSAIQKNDIIKLKPGRLLLDVIIISGKTKAIESIMTGNETPKQYQKGQRIRSGSIIIESEGLAQVQNIFEKSILIQIGSQINMAHNSQQSNQSSIQTVCKTISNHFVKAVISFSTIVTIIWSILLGFDLVKVEDQGCKICFVVQRGVGVLVASCPCALGLAVPSVIAMVLNLAVKSGILIRKNNVFQKIKKCKIVAFDKTGTLFTQVQQIQNFQLMSKKLQQKQIWQILAIVQKQFRHPLAQILYKQAFNRSQVTGTNFKFLLLSQPQIQKEGVIAQVRNKQSNQTYKIKIGNKYLLQKYGLQLPNQINNYIGSTMIYLVINQQIQMMITLNTHSNLRPQTIQVITKLQKMGKQVHILSGDSKQSVGLLSEALNISIDCQHAQFSANMKKDWIKKIQLQRNVGVMMIGDGLNDIPCLQEASIGVSINAKSELNLNAADIIILSQNLFKIVAIFKLLKKSSLFININLFWAFAYNLAMIPIVSGMLSSFNLTISPVWSSIAMSISSLTVVLFSQLLLCYSYDQSLIQQTEQTKIPKLKKLSLQSNSNLERKHQLKSTQVNYKQFHQQL